tara:strand:- start:110 stop:355 length:246 start_codon:yes stop_codon:yes gene_type:complete
MIAQEWWRRRFEAELVEPEIVHEVWEAAQIFGDNAIEMQNDIAVLRESLDSNSQARKIKELEACIIDLEDKLDNEQTLRTL